MLKYIDMQNLKSLKKSISAGAMIGIGSAIYLTLENKMIGAILFSIGLFAICSFEMNLFTGKIGYVIETRNKPNCLVVWFGNLLGSIIISTIIRLAKPELHIKAKEFILNKLQQPFISVIFLSMLCGMLMFLAVDNYTKQRGSLSGILGIFLCVTTFILCGFEHSIADMNYYILAIDLPKKTTNFKHFISIASAFYGFISIVSVFNGIGALFMKWLATSDEKSSEINKR